MKTNILSWKTANIVSYLVNKQEKKLGVEHMRRRKTSTLNKSREKLSTLWKKITTKFWVFAEYYTRSVSRSPHFLRAYKYIF